MGKPVCNTIIHQSTCVSISANHTHGRPLFTLLYTLLDVPARLKKELDTVLVLQADIDNTNKLLQLARTTIEKGNATPGILDALASFEHTHVKLAAQAETLYSSLNMHDQFPELSHVDLDFVRILLMARDLKINIQKRAVGSFFEWDRLDRAVGGKDKPLGEFHRELALLLTRR